MELSTAWPLHLITALILLQHGNAIEEQCQACRSVSVRILVASCAPQKFPEASTHVYLHVQAELLDRLAKEKPKDALDLRNRLDSQGKRYGRVIQFRCTDHACLH